MNLKLSSQVRHHVATGDLENAITTLLHAIPPNSELYNMAILQSTRLQKLKKDHIKGIITPEEFNAEFLRIGYALLEISKEITVPVVRLLGSKVNWYATILILLLVSILFAVFFNKDFFYKTRGEEPIIPAEPLESPSKYFEEAAVQQKVIWSRLNSNKIATLKTDFPVFFSNSSIYALIGMYSGFIKIARDAFHFSKAKLKSTPEPEVYIIDEGIIERSEKGLLYKVHIGNKMQEDLYAEKLVSRLILKTSGYGFFYVEDEDIEFTLEMPETSGYYQHTLRTTPIPANGSQTLYFRLKLKNDSNNHITRIREYHFKLVLKRLSRNDEIILSMKSLHFFD